jgi:hypothetical protein
VTDDTPTMIFSRVELADLPLEPAANGAKAIDGKPATGARSVTNSKGAIDGRPAADSMSAADSAGPPPRDATATGVIAALTEDGPLDAER